MQPHIGVGGNPKRLLLFGIGHETRQGQIERVQIHFDGFGCARAKVERRVVRIRLTVDPPFAGERQSRDVAGGATNTSKHFFAVPNRFFDCGICRNDAAGYRHSGLEQGDGRYVGAGEFVDKTIAIRICINAESLSGLNAVVLIERRI